MRNPVPWPRVRRVDPSVGYRDSAEPYLAVSRHEVDELLAVEEAAADLRQLDELCRRNRRRMHPIGACSWVIGTGLGIALAIGIETLFGGR